MTFQKEYDNSWTFNDSVLKQLQNVKWNHKIKISSDSKSLCC